MTTTKKPVILIDGSSYLFRAYHALPPLTNSKGQPTGAVYGVINMIRKLINDYQPDFIGVVFDSKEKTHRHKIYPEYKAHRPLMPDELQVQIKPLHDIIKAMGLPLIIESGIEADDLIGTLTKQAEKQGQSVLISTGDKDMAQLVNEHVTLINTMNEVVMDEAGVVEKFGVSPRQIIDYLALVGDTSDNIPGVPKVGPKTASKWLQDYGSLDNIIAQSAAIGGKIGENLRASLDKIPLSKELVTIMTDLPLKISINELKPKTPDEQALLHLFTELEFNTWLKNLIKEEQPVDVNYETILDEQVFDAWIKKLNASPYFSFDTETTSLDTIYAEIVGLSFSVKTGEAAYVPLAHDYEGAPKQLDRKWVLNQLKPLLNDAKKTIIGQNLKYDINVLAKYEISIQAPILDTMLESYVLNSASTRHDMDSLAVKYLNKMTVKFEDIAGKGAKQLTFNKILIETASHYAAQDADITLQLHEAMSKKMKDHKILQNILKDIEIPLMRVLAKIEYNGVLIDADMLKKQSREIAEKLKKLEESAYILAGEEFNLSSPKQLQEIFYQKLHLPILKKTPTGQPSTAEPVLQELALQYEFPKIILEHRTLSKLKSTYTDKLPLQINKTSGRVHTSYNQAVTTTGRLSSTDPNLQNIPIRSEEGRRIRQAFIAPQGYKLVSADYSQIEMRIMAHLSGDKNLRKAFLADHDVHRSTASEVFGVKPEDVTPDQRRAAKAINYGLIYGMSSYGLAQQIGVKRNVAQEYMDLYFERYPGIKIYMDNTRKHAHEMGYVETILGRRLYLPDINTSNMVRQKAAERTAINAPMQGTSADLMKIAMIRVEAWIEEKKLDAKMIMQVHDELVFEVLEKDVETLKKGVKEIMESAMKLEVPLEVGLGVGNNWDEAH